MLLIFSLVLLQSEDLLIISTLIIIHRFTRLIFIAIMFKCHQLSSNLIKMNLRLHKSFILEEWSKVQKLSRSITYKLLLLSSQSQCNTMKGGWLLAWFVGCLVCTLISMMMRWSMQNDIHRNNSSEQKHITKLYIGAWMD